jgi:hypothetical protein
MARENNVVGIREKRNAYIILIVKFKGNRPLGRSRLQNSL